MTDQQTSPAVLSEQEIAEIAAWLAADESDNELPHVPNITPRRLILTITDLQAKLAAAEGRASRNWDNPEFDSTDAAHPAWWRGNDRGVEGATDVFTRALTEPQHSGKFSSDKMNILREAIWGLRARAEAAESALKKMREVLRQALPMAEKFARLDGSGVIRGTAAEILRKAAAALSPASSSTGGENG